MENYSNSFENLEEYYHYIKEFIHLAPFKALRIVKCNRGRGKPYWWDTDIDDKSKRKNKFKKCLTTKKIEDRYVNNFKPRY